MSAGSYVYFGVTSVSPTSGGTLGTNTITIHGQGFTNVTGVMFGLVPAVSFTVVSSTEIQAQVPAGLGTVDVEVINGGLAASVSTAASQYSYTGGPPGSSGIVEPTGGGDADALNLASQISGYCAQQNCTSLGYGSLAQSASNFTAPVTAPAGSSAPEGVPWWDWAGDALSVVGLGCAFAPEFCAPIAVATAVAGLAISLYGTAHDYCASAGAAGLAGLCSLFIDPSGTIVDQSGNPISGATATLLGEPPGGGAFAPVDPASGAIQPATNPETSGATGSFDWDALAGTYEVQASAPGCSDPHNASDPDVLTAPFVLPPPAIGLVLSLRCATAQPPQAPAITAVGPGSGPSQGGNTVLIAGTGLTGATAVTFGTVRATEVQVLSSYAIAAVAPAGAGTVDVTVTTAGGTSATGNADNYSYATPQIGASSPAISAISPSTGPTAGGTLVTITGANLAGTYAVSFGGSPATNVTVVSPSEVTAVTPASSFPVKVDTTITTAIGISTAVPADTFTFGAPAAPATPTLAVSATPTSAIAGQQVMLAVTVAPTDGAGTVSFYANGSTSPISGCAVLVLTSGAGGGYGAACTTTALAAGSDTITAGYSGDASYEPVTARTTVTVTGPPVSIAPPSIAGNTTPGQVLAESHGAWTDSPTTYAYQWQDCAAAGDGCADVAGATGQTYTLTAGDVGHTIRVQEAAGNVAGTSQPVSSAETGVVAAVPGPAPTPTPTPTPTPNPSPGPAQTASVSAPGNALAPVIAGTLTVGASLTTTTGAWSGAPAPGYAYQWQRCAPTCADISGATAAAYTLAAADLGATVRVVVTAANSAGSATADATAVGPVRPNAAEIDAALAAVLTPAGKASTIKSIVRSGRYAASLAGPGPGTLTIVWRATQAGHKVTIATGHVAVTTSTGATAVKVVLSSAGRRVLAHARSLKVSASATFTPAGQSPVSLSRAFSLHN